MKNNFLKKATIYYIITIIIGIYIGIKSCINIIYNLFNDIKLDNTKYLIVFSLMLLLAFVGMYCSRKFMKYFDLYEKSKKE